MSAAGWVLGVDSGGSGMRVALACAGREAPEALASAQAVRTGTHGIDAEHFLAELLPLARQSMARAGIDSLSAVAVGAAGMASLGDDLRARLPQALERELGAGQLALAADAVTGYAGAVGLRSGTVVAAGTGMIALGTDLRTWRRADGWGHLLGDCGSGAWIGRAGLEAAMRAHDGRSGGSTALLDQARQQFGPTDELPSRLYPRTDRPAVLASFAPRVASCAQDDASAAEIMRRAAGHIADAAAAVTPQDAPVALTGGLFRLGEPLTVPLHAELGRLLPGSPVALDEAGPLQGALRIAAALAEGGLRLPHDGRLLWTRK